MDFLLFFDQWVNSYNGYFVDLFVRVSNAVAVEMYKKLGYTVYRRVIGYYSNEEDAFGEFPICFVVQKRVLYS